MSTKAATRKKIPQIINQSVLSPSTGSVSPLQMARSGAMSLDDLIKTADEWQKEGRASDVDELYSTWIDGTSSPYKFVACFNYGVLLAGWGRDQDAIRVYEKAIALNPLFAHARVNLGLTMERIGQANKAFEYWKQIVENPEVSNAAGTEMLTTALNHIGRLNEVQRNYAEAESALAKSLKINPNQHDALHHWFHLRQKQCKWPVLEALDDVTENMILNAMSPLAALAYDDDPAFQMHVAEKIVREKFTYNTTPLADRVSYGHQKIRVGYLSGDLCTHAVGLILPELFEIHDRARFEIYAYDYSREDGSPLRKRYKQNIEHFNPIQALSDHQAALKIREDEIDILVDLHGLSLGLRAAIMAQRPAPVQMTYLGYIGTTMMPYIDYVITDRYCFHKDLGKYYSEKPLLLDHCCLPTDRKKNVDQTPTRQDIGLPDNKFIFATFNNSYKLNEKMFRCWAQILHRLPESVLWIVDDNPWATGNLKTFAAECGIDSSRLIFTERVPPSAYLARMPLADIFLDNHPYNAGSTASDIMWMGVPMITLSGKTFVSRMAGSMLHYAGLDELIAANHQEYVTLAVELASDQARLTTIRKKLLAQRETGGAFDMEKFTRNLEDKYAQVVY
jgi:predicted O-linked N-acetylglucosamine transferase (SPINDLY family)